MKPPDNKTSISQRTVIVLESTSYNVISNLNCTEWLMSVETHAWQCKLVKFEIKWQLYKGNALIEFMTITTIRTQNHNHNKDELRI